MSKQVKNKQKTDVLSPSSSPFAVINWLKKNYQPQQIVMTTSFGMEGCAMIDMLNQQGISITIADIDTGFLFEETKALRQRIRQKYSNLNFETWYPELSPLEQDRHYGKQLWLKNPNQCCELRKVRPLRNNLPRFQVWLTGIRKSQSESRKSLTPIFWDWQNQILKICPLANWQRSDVWDYISANNVPYNPLHERGYPSVGCTHCTSRVPGLVELSSYSRAGRWAGNEKTECGLHFTPES